MYEFNVLLVGLGVTAALGYWLWSRRDMYRVSWECDGPVALPMVGNLPLLMRHRTDIMQLLIKLTTTYTSPLRFWAGTDMFLIVHDSEDIETIVKSPNCLSRLYYYKYISEAISDAADGLFTSSGPIWKMHRRLVGQAFGLHAIYSHMPIFNQHMQTLVKTIDAEVGKEAFDIRLRVNRTTISMFLESMLGTDFTPEEKKKFSYYLTNGQQILAKRLFQPWFQFDPLWNLTYYPRTMKKYIAYGSKLVDGILSSKMNSVEGDLTFVDRLLHISTENPKFTLADVKVETLTLLMGASDTSAVTIAFTTLMLAMHPEYQQRVYEELSTIMPDRNTPLTSVHLEQMEFTERCIKETLRLFPTVPIIGRTVDKEMKLKDITVKPGQGILLAIGQLQRNPKYWGERAAEFDPDNFLPDRVASRSSLIYLPFSDGARSCIAYKYAQVVVRAMIFHLFRTHRYTTDLKMNELKIQLNINVRLLNNHMVQVHRREI